MTQSDIAKKLKVSRQSVATNIKELKDNNVIDKFRETIHKFIGWNCVNFDMSTGDTLIRDFERETRICLDGEEQMKQEEREKDLEREL